MQKEKKNVYLNHIRSYTNKNMVTEFEVISIFKEFLFKSMSYLISNLKLLCLNNLSFN